VNNTCPSCNGKCCQAVDYGYHVVHMGAEAYMHWCDDCHDGQVPKPDPRDEKIAAMQATIEHYSKELAEKHEVNIGHANAMLVADMRINRAINLCEFILSGTGPEEPTAHERALAKSVLLALQEEEVKPMTTMPEVF